MTKEDYKITMAGHSNFSDTLRKRMLEDLSNTHQDNYDAYLFGDTSDIYGDFCRTTRMNAGALSAQKNRQDRTVLVEKLMESVPFAFLYDHLEIGEDKELLIRLCAFRILGPEKTKLPGFDVYMASVKETEKIFKDLFNGELTDPLSAKDSELGGFRSFISHFNKSEKNPYRIIRRFDLSRIRFPLQMYDSFLFVFQQFVLKQYEYDQAPVTIKANKGDVVIDAGACWGETALLFSHQAGATGRVYAFEMMPENIRIFKTNLQLNPNLAERIHLIEQPLAEKSGRPVMVKKLKTASSISPTTGGKTTDVFTVSIDDFIEVRNIKTVDFIKMDIEGSEVSALEGCARTIKRFAPDLAICIYHKKDDFESIPRRIKSLNPEYRFYLKHNGIYLWETVLFATAKPECRSMNRI